MITFSSRHKGEGLGIVLDCLTLEDRLTPSLAFQFDYSLDSSGFFNNVEARQSLERAGAQLASYISSTPAAINPAQAFGGGWEAIFFHPVTDAEVRIPNLTIPEGVMRVYVGAAAGHDNHAGEGGPGGYSVSGPLSFQRTVASRGQSGFASWGGALTFDISKDWYFGADVNGLQSNQIDFHTVATHELGHVLGFGTSNAYNALAHGGRFVGGAATANYGSAPPLSGDGAHWQQGILANGQAVSLQPILPRGQRIEFSTLDYAALQDLGWQIGASQPTTPIPTTAPIAENRIPQPEPINTISQLGSNPTPIVGTPSKLTVVSGANNGQADIFRVSSSGQLTPAASSFQPFGDFQGPVRSAVADVNGDGIDDVILGTGANGGSQVRVLNGKDFTDLVTPFSVFEQSYRGGVFLAAGDFNNDGRADIVVTPDQGGGPRVRIYDAANGQANVIADFMGIDDPNFRGGARSTVGDINGDGADDLIVAAGFGGGPRVSILDGTTISNGQRRKLTPDFFAFEQTLRNGVYITAGDFNADGRDDLSFGGGPGGAPRVMILDGNTLTQSGGPTAIANPISSFFAGNADQRGGIRVSAVDFNNDGTADLITGSGTGSEVRTYASTQSGVALLATNTPNLFGSIDGIYVG